MTTQTATQVLAEQASVESRLKAAGAHLWSPEAIGRHKTAELRKAPRANVLWQWVEQIQTTIFVFFAVTVLAAAVAVVFGVLSGIAGLLSGNLAVPLIAFICAGVAIGFAFGMTMLDTVKIKGPARWRHNTCGVNEGIAHFAGLDIPLPAEAKELIRKVRAFLNEEHHFGVHALIQDKISLDPILDVAVFEDGKWNTYYILVWDDNGIVSPH